MDVGVALKNSHPSKHTDSEVHEICAANNCTWIAEPYINVATHIRVRRNCGHEHLVILGSIIAGHGCGTCKGGGYNKNAAGAFYVVSGKGIIKCGITNSPEKRLTNHRLQGLEKVHHLIDNI